jgi:hypothetical protein
MKILIFTCLILGLFGIAQAQVTTLADLQGGGWTQIGSPEKVISGNTFKVTGLKLETQYKGQEVQLEKDLQMLVGTTWKFSEFAGMDSPKNIVRLNNKSDAEYNIGMGSLYIQIPGEKLWQGNIFTKGNLVCFIHDAYNMDNISCLITWKKEGSSDANPTSNTPSKGWIPLANGNSIFSKFNLKIISAEIETNDNVTTAFAQKDFEDIFQGGEWILKPEGSTYRVQNSGFTDNGTYKLLGSSIEFTSATNPAETHKFFTKGENVGIQMIYQSRHTKSEVKMMMVFEKVAKQGRDLFADALLAKMNLNFVSKANNQLYYSCESPFAGSPPYENFYYDVNNKNELEVYVANNGISGRNDELVTTRIPIQNIKVEGFRMIGGGYGTKIIMPLEKSIEEETHKDSKTTKRTISTEYEIATGSFNSERVLGLLDKIAAKLPAAKKQTYNAGAARRKAEAADFVAKEKALEAQLEAERAKNAANNVSNNATSYSSNSPKTKAKISVTLQNKSGASVAFIIHSKKGSSKLETSLSGSSRKSYTVEVGGKVTNMRGGLIATFTEGSEGQTIIIGQ